MYGTIWPEMEFPGTESRHLITRAWNDALVINNDFFYEIFENISKKTSMSILIKLGYKIIEVKKAG